MTNRNKTLTKRQRKALQPAAERTRACGRDEPTMPYRVFGKGDYNYITMCRKTGTVTVYRFETQAEADQAMQEGIANDLPCNPIAAA